MYPIIPSVWAPRTSSGYGSTSVYAEPWSASRPTCGPLPCEMTSSCSRATGASALQATRAFARWFSAVSGSPRRRSAFPPSATTTRTSFAEGRDHHRFDRVQPVLSFVEHDRGLGLEHLLGDLERLHAELVE